MSNIQVTNIKNLSGNNTVAISSASGDLIVKNDLIAESAVEISGTITANSSGLEVLGISTLTELVVNDIISIGQSVSIASGIITATSFVGDGSGLTGVIGSGSGVVIKDNDTTVGTAGTINFGPSFNVSPTSAGIVTVTSGYIVDGKWTLGANGTNDYTFTGIGFTQTTNDPVLYLARGRIYEFVNNTGGSHPFQIRVSSGGVSYDDGVTNNGSSFGTIRFEIPFNAPNTLYYQCTNHSAMGNVINIYPTTA